MRTTIFDRLSLPLLALGTLLCIVAFVLSFTVAPLVNGAQVDGFALIGGQMVTNMLLLSQKIFYFHMPVALVSMAALFFTALYGVLFLRSRDRKHDVRAKAATEIALIFVLMTMVSGELWERLSGASGGPGNQG
jgi:heme exporter protein C